jgi:hypothetical protein
MRASIPRARSAASSSSSSPSGSGSGLQVAMRSFTQRA